MTWFSCPTCDGNGTDEHGGECPTCEGRGWFASPDLRGMRGDAA